jgi:8-oxo-dGTP diphosphatase
LDPDPSLPLLAVAVTTVGARFALQLRDDRADVAWGGHWGLFGGSVEAGETPAAAIVRELHEELMLHVPCCRLLWATREHRDWRGRQRELHVFHADLTALWARHELREGERSGLFPDDGLPDRMVPAARAIIHRFRQERITHPAPD